MNKPTEERSMLLTRRKTDDPLCPRCLDRGTLSDVDRGGRDKFGRPILNRYCDSCQYEYPASYSLFQSLSFSSIGVPNSGSTVWTVMLYHQIKSRQLPLKVNLSLLPSGFNAIFDMLTEDMLCNGVVPNANSPELPYPLLFYHRSRRRLFRSSDALINLFDFAGEAMYRDAFTDLIRRRIIACEGLLCFLDPTNYNFTQQINELMRLLDDIRRYRCISPNEKLDIPVALCIAKIDLLVTHNQMDDAARPWIKTLRETADAPFRLRTIRNRSKHFLGVCDQIFPNTSLEKILETRLGKNVMYFPLSSISIEDDQLGIVDLAQRNIIPFGILEPFCWLLHRNGYQVF
jgi:hypothetical protein